MGNIKTQSVLSDLTGGTVVFHQKGIKDRDIQLFLNEPSMQKFTSIQNLKELTLSYNKIEQEGARMISSCNFYQLVQLNLCSWNNLVNDKGAKWITNGFFPSLKILWLSKNSIGPEGCKYLACAPFRNLTQLDLMNNQIDDKGAQFILAFGVFQNLVQLGLSDNRITKEGVNQLSSCFLQNLSVLGLWNNKLLSETENQVQSWKLRNKRGESLQILF